MGYASKREIGSIPVFIAMLHGVFMKKIGE